MEQLCWNVGLWTPFLTVYMNQSSVRWRITTTNISSGVGTGLGSVRIIHKCCWFYPGFRAERLVSGAMESRRNRHSPQLPRSQLHTVGGWGQEVEPSQNVQPPPGHSRVVPDQKCLSESNWLCLADCCAVFPTYATRTFNPSSEPHMSSVRFISLQWQHTKAWAYAHSIKCNLPCASSLIMWLPVSLRRCHP